jgi:adenosylcobinamide-phosphate synthase
MRLELEIGIAIVLDLIIGDPRWLPHPVKLIGRAAAALEAPMRRLFCSPRLAGVMTALVVISGTALIAWSLIFAAGFAGAWLQDAISILLIYFAFAAHDLAGHAFAVYKALKEENLEKARVMVSRVVGRDTACLDERGVVRAAVESVAENTVDGVTAPLFFAFLGGPVGALTYKAISTLDSTFGYKNERYLYFGWASARIDDLAAWIPARLTLPFISLAAAFTGLHPWLALRYGLRDGGKHASPNSAISEAASAGALGVQLGGPLYRQGLSWEAPLLGESMEPLQRHHILTVIRLMLMTALLFSLFLGAVRTMIVH